MSIYGRNHYNIKKNKKHRWGARGEAQKGRDIWIPMAIILRLDRKQQNSTKQLSFN